MGTNRYKDVVEVESSEDSDSAYFDDNDHDNENHSDNYHGSKYQYLYAGDEENVKRDAYKQVTKQYAELKIIKRKLVMSLSCEASKQHCLRIPNVTSTSFSVPTFASVIDSLTPAYRKVIEDFGFGSLLMFDKCFVPIKFVKWVASLVNYRSGDVVIDGKVIYLDHVDFGSRQVPDSIPRISVWKGNMLREYADYDLKYPGFQHHGSIPLGDSTNTLSSKKRKKSVSFITKEDHLSDVILVDNEPRYYVPDSISPSPKPGYTRYHSKKTPIHTQDMDLSPHVSPRTNLFASKPRSGSSAKAKSQSQDSLVNSKEKVCPEVEILAKTTLADNVRIMTQECDELYNSKLKRSGHSDHTPKDVFPFNPSSCQFTTHTQPFRIRESTTGRKSPVHGPRRVIKPAPLFNGDYVTTTKGFHVSNSQAHNYSIICKLASSKHQCEDAVNLSGVRCTFWALGDSLKPEGLVKTFVISAFCYSLFLRPSGHPDISKRHYFFPNISDNLLKDIDDADEDVLARAFGRSSKARPLSRSNMHFFPTYSEFQEIVRERLRNSFQFHWKKFVKLDMGFPRYEFSYPHVPQQPSDNNTDSGIYAMMFIKHWLSPRTVLTSVFTHEDIPNIRVKIANALVFQPKNSGMIQRIKEFKDEVSYYFIFYFNLKTQYVLFFLLNYLSSRLFCFFAGSVLV
ncbi:unnamed protein product [Urochloa decumbens]|uniref:Uncharacterized protein n=1 Tax=Urochloa decumbens TaxID=240449 RepID=A0ABC8Y398_9POAL